MQTQAQIEAMTNGASSVRTLAVLAAMLMGGALLINALSRPAHADVPAPAPLQIQSVASVSASVDWSRVPAAPVTPGQTVGAYD